MGRRRQGSILDSVGGFSLRFVSCFRGNNILGGVVGAQGG